MSVLVAEDKKPGSSKRDRKCSKGGIRGSNKYSFDIMSRCNELQTEAQVRFKSGM